MEMKLTRTQATGRRRSDAIAGPSGPVDATDAGASQHDRPGRRDLDVGGSAGAASVCRLRRPLFRGAGADADAHLRRRRDVGKVQRLQQRLLVAVLDGSRSVRPPFSVNCVKECIRAQSQSMTIEKSSKPKIVQVSECRTGVAFPFADAVADAVADAAAVALAAGDAAGDAAAAQRLDARRRKSAQAADADHIHQGSAADADAGVGSSVGVEWQRPRRQRRRPVHPRSQTLQ